MNVDIYNKRVASFQLKANELEKSILNGTLNIGNFVEFSKLYQQIKDMNEEFDFIYNSIPNSVTQSYLLKFLKNEKIFLTLITNLLNNLKHYHNVVRYVDNYEIQQEWEYVKPILNYRYKVIQTNKQMEDSFFRFVTPYSNHKTKFYNRFINLNEEMKATKQATSNAINNIKKLGNAEEKITETHNEIYEKDNVKIANAKDNINELSKEALKSIDALFNRLEVEYDMVVKDQETNNETENIIRASDVELDEEYLKTLSKESGIEYLKSIIANIEKLPGKKATIKFKGTKVRISSKYHSRWLKCQTMLNQYLLKYEKAIEEINEKRREAEEKQAKEEYANIYANFKDAEKKLFLLAYYAREYLNTNQVVAVASLNGEPLYILKKDLNRFNPIFMDYKKYQHEVDDCARKNNIEIIDSDKKLESLENLERKLYSDICELRNQGANIEKIEELKSKLYNLNKGKKFALLANLKVVFKSSAFINLANDIKTVLINVSENPEEFINSNEYATDEKRQILNNVINYLKEYIDNTKERRVEKKQEGKNYSKEILKQHLSKIKRCFNLLPKNKKETFKIKDFHDAKNKIAMKKAVAYAAVPAGILLGVFLLSNTSNASSEKTKSNIETNIENDLTNETNNSIVNNSNLQELFKKSAEQIKSFSQETNKMSETQNETIENHKEVGTIDENKEENIYEQAYHDFGEPFTIESGAEIHTTAEDMANHINGKNPYFADDSIRFTQGIVYEYNGERITLWANDPDDVATKIAIENNGARQIGFVGENEKATTKGPEGFFQIDDTQFIERGGR